MSHAVSPSKKKWLWFSWWCGGGGVVVVVVVVVAVVVTVVVVSLFLFLLVLFPTAPVEKVRKRVAWSTAFSYFFNAALLKHGLMNRLVGWSVGYWLVGCFR